ncbi:hypothetical protein V5O48_009325 [Marasmius crinis-equi]|uniref:G-protein coupled receptors family 2 profile 2 domain-containing protein n=1 Tax=Marasmius crinis-equi TaxID=585013 RepID=A0ABR3FBS1_9AGAR
MLFGIASAVGGTRTGPGFICGFSIFVLQLTLQFSGFLLFCIALNLQLVVVHGMNGKRLEKFYLIGSTVLAFALVVPPYAAHQYGWDPLEKDCWYTNDNRGQRIAWQVGTQVAWTFFTVIGELICSIIVLTFLLRHNLNFRRVFNPTTTSSIQASRGTRSTAPRVVKATRYKSIIVRVGDFLYGGRAIVYALLAATDPALIRGVKSLVQIGLGRESMGLNTTAKDPTSMASSNSNGVVVHIELSSFQSPPPGHPPPPEHRDSKVHPTSSSNATLKRDVEVSALNTHDIYPNRYPEGSAYFQPRLTSSLSATEERRRRMSERELMEEDSFEKEL